MTRKALYIVQGAPYSTSAGIEALEMAMISASFEQSTSMLFIHDGVFQEDLLVPVELLTSQQVAALLAHQDQVITL